MLRPEARWFGQRLRALPTEAIYPQLNLGSQTLHFRTQEQPWIDAFLFAPARHRGGVVVHADLQAAPGVDLVGDLTDPQFLAQVRNLCFRSVICSNLLEHVVGPKRIADAATAAVVPGGYLFVSVPFRFPYHPDPIDTLFRPSPAELAALFPGTRVVEQRLVRGWLIGYAWEKLLRQTIQRHRSAGQSAAQPRAPAAVLTQTVRWLPWLWQPFEISCLVLRKAE
jgi:hypothetical protein